MAMQITIPVIVSGGQTGADRGALEWAVFRGIAHGGWCPKGRRAEDGTIPEDFNLRQTPNADYSERTEWNVRDSDATVIFTQTPALEGGSKLTMEFAIKHKKPCLHLPMSSDSAQSLQLFLAEQKPKVLNVAGQRGSEAPGLAAMVRAVLDEVFFPTPNAGSSSSDGDGGVAPKFGMITRQEALAIAEAFLSVGNHPIPGRRVSAIVAGDDVSRRFGLYNVDVTECWIAYVYTPLRGLQSSSIVAVSRKTGAIVYAGGANDEG